MLISERNGDKVTLDHNGLPHCENGPAEVFGTGLQRYKKHGVLHREGGPAVIYPNGDETWYFEGVIHREGGPAITSSKSQIYMRFGVPHRLDGPAIIRKQKKGDDEYWAFGKRIPSFQSNITDSEYIIVNNTLYIKV